MKRTDTRPQTYPNTPENTTKLLSRSKKSHFRIIFQLRNDLNKVAALPEIVSFRTLARNTFQAKHGRCWGRIETKRCDIEIRIDRLAKSASRRNAPNKLSIHKNIDFKILPQVYRVIVPIGWPV